MRNSKEQLIDLLRGEYAEDFKAKPKIKPKTEESRLIESFEEINSFYEENGFLPREDSEDFRERSLCKRISNFQDNTEKLNILIDYDKYNLLGRSGSTLEKNNSDIFDTSELPKIKKPINRNDKSAKRKLAENFDDYEKLFKEQQALLKADIKRLEPFKNVNQIRIGGFYVYGGMMCYIDKIHQVEKNLDGYLHKRMRVLFENGTVSNMYKRSLERRLYDAGGFEVVDNTSGYIYVLKSLSNNDKIQTIEDFYKIGFTTGTVEDRIKDAKEDLTFLMAPVEIVGKYKVLHNINPYKIEHIIHTFLTAAKIDLTITDNNGKNYKPQEWYSVPFSEIEYIVELIANGEIKNYYYDKNQRTIKRRS